MTGRRGWLMPGVLVLLAGCGVTGTSGSGAEAAGLRQQAAQVLARWDEAVQGSAGLGFAPVGELTGQIGEWEASTGDNNKIALLSGQVAPVADLPSGAVPDGTVTYPDGTKTPVQVLSAAEALQQVSETVEQQDCGGCHPLRVTGARLVQLPIQTNRGTAKAPAWLFAVQGTRVKISRIAVGPQQVISVSPVPSTSGGISVEGAALAADGVTLTVAFTGTPGPATQPCGADYTAEAIESSTAVAVIVTEQPYTDGSLDAQFCTAIGARRTAVTTLSRPLRDRTVLEIRAGQPVPTTRA